MHPRHGDVLRTLPLVKFLDAAVCQIKGIAQVLRQLPPGSAQIVFGHRDRHRPKAVEAFGVFSNGGISALANIVENPVHQ